MGNISKILIEIWTVLSNNAFLGAFVASLISWLFIYFITEKIQVKNKIQALKKELESNVALLEYSIKESLENKELQFVHFYFDSFSQIRNSNLTDKIGDKNYNRLLYMYDRYKLIDTKMEHIKGGWLKVKDLDQFVGALKNLKEVTGDIIEKIK
jgi:hypothetical protein